MPKIDWRLVERAFSAVQDVDSSDRDRLITAMCGVGSAESIEVYKLLDDCGKSEDFFRLNLSALAKEFIHQSTMDIGSLVLKRYRIVSVLGAGGMGLVFEAKDEHFEPARRVAVKMAKIDLALDPKFADRFRLEANVLSLMTDERIVRIYDVGEEGGNLVIVMEFVDGKPLMKRRESMDPRSAARMLVELADAITQPHNLGIIHRDLKPDNVLIASNNMPKIADFGIAKFLGESQQRKHTGTLHRLSSTQVGQVVGTTEYMAPEQWRGESIGPECDIYALGAILYELLQGYPPYVDQLFTPDSVESESTSSSKSEHQSFTTNYRNNFAEVVLSEQKPTRIDRVSRDLEAICFKCLQLDPNQRYSDAKQLSKDLLLFLKGKPVSARQIGWPTRTVMWCRRHPVGVVALSLLISTILAIGIGFIQVSAANVATSLALNETQSQLASTMLTTSHLEERYGNPSSAISYAAAVLDFTEPSDPRYLDAVETIELNLASIPDPSLHSHPPDRFANFNKEMAIVTGGRDGSVRIWNLDTGSLKTAPFKFRSSVTSAALSPDDETICIGLSDGTLALWKLSDKEDTYKEVLNKGAITALSFSADGSSILYANAGQMFKGEPRISIRSVADFAKLVDSIEVDTVVTQIACSPVSRRRFIATALSGSGASGTIELWETKDRLEKVGAIVSLDENENVTAVSWSNEGALAFASFDAAHQVGKLHMVEFKTERDDFGKVKQVVLGGMLVGSLLVEGKAIETVFVGDSSRTAVFELDTVKGEAKSKATYETPHFQGITHIFRSNTKPKTLHALTHSTCHSVFKSKITPTCRTNCFYRPVTKTIVSNNPEISRAILNVSSKNFVYLSDEGAVEIVNLELPETKLLSDKCGEMASMAIDREGQWLAVNAKIGSVAIFDVNSADLISSCSVEIGTVLDMSFDAIGKRLAIVGSESKIALVEQGDDAENLHFENIASIELKAIQPSMVEFDPEDNGRIVIGTLLGQVYLYQLDTKSLERVGGAGISPDYVSMLSELQLSADGRVVAIATADGRVTVLDLDDGSRFETIGINASSLSFCPSNEMLAIGDVDGNVRLWKYRTSKFAGQAISIDDEVLSLGWSHDGRELYFAGTDNVVKMVKFPKLDHLPVGELKNIATYYSGLRVEGRQSELVDVPIEERLKVSLPSIDR